MGHFESKKNVSKYFSFIKYKSGSWIFPRQNHSQCELVHIKHLLLSLKCCYLSFQFFPVTDVNFYLVLHLILTCTFTYINYFLNNFYNLHFMSRFDRFMLFTCVFLSECYFLEHVEPKTCIYVCTSHFQVVILPWTLLLFLMFILGFAWPSVVLIFILSVKLQVSYYQCLFLHLKVGYSELPCLIKVFLFLYKITPCNAFSVTMFTFYVHIFMLTYKLFNCF